MENKYYRVLGKATSGNSFFAINELVPALNEKEAASTALEYVERQIRICTVGNPIVALCYVVAPRVKRENYTPIITEEQGRD